MEMKTAEPTTTPYQKALSFFWSIGGFVPVVSELNFSGAADDTFSSCVSAVDFSSDSGTVASAGLWMSPFGP